MWNIKNVSLLNRKYHILLVKKIFMSMVYDSIHYRTRLEFVLNVSLYTKNGLTKSEKVYTKQKLKWLLNLLKFLTKT